MKKIFLLFAFFLLANSQNSGNQNENNQVVDPKIIEDKSYQQQLIEKIEQQIIDKITSTSFDLIDSYLFPVKSYLPFEINQKITNIDHLREKKKELLTNSSSKQIRVNILNKLENQLLSVLLTSIAQTFPDILKENLIQIIKAKPLQVQEIENMLNSNANLSDVLLRILEWEKD